MSSTGAAVACSAAGELIVVMRGVDSRHDTAFAFMRQRFGVLAK